MGFVRSTYVFCPVQCARSTRYDTLAPNFSPTRPVLQNRQSLKADAADIGPQARAGRGEGTRIPRSPEKQGFRPLADRDTGTPGQRWGREGVLYYGQVLACPQARSTADAVQYFLGVLLVFQSGILWLLVFDTLVHCLFFFFLFSFIFFLFCFLTSCLRDLLFRKDCRPLHNKKNVSFFPQGGLLKPFSSQVVE